MFLREFKSSILYNKQILVKSKILAEIILLIMKLCHHKIPMKNGVKEEFKC